MNDITDHSVEGERSAHRDRPDEMSLSTVEATDAHEALSISCDDCSMRCTAACDDCVVSFLVGEHDDDSLVLDLDQARVVRLLGRAGLVPDLKYRVAG